LSIVRGRLVIWWIEAMAQELEQVSVKISPEERAELERVAAAEHRSLSAQLRHLAVKGLKEHTQEERAA
jgi:hypothetical protein